MRLDVVYAALPAHWSESGARERQVAGQKLTYVNRPPLRITPSFTAFKIHLST